MSTKIKWKRVFKDEIFCQEGKSDIKPSVTYKLCKSLLGDMVTVYVQESYVTTVDGGLTKAKRWCEKDLTRRLKGR